MSEDRLERKFEGRAVLDALLEKAGSHADTEDVATAFLEAQKDKVPASVVIDALFDDEPRFENPKSARALYGNLFGLWELLEQGKTVDLTAPAPRGPRPKKPEPVEKPLPFENEPDAAYCESVWRWLEGGAEREVQKVEHAWDNKQDVIITWLDESGLSDVGFGLAQHLLFELFVMLELGTPKGVDRVQHAALASKPEGTAGLPPALVAWAEETVSEVEDDELDPLPEAERDKVRQCVMTGLSALWAARRV